jgi:hypothetical protein
LSVQKENEKVNEVASLFPRTKKNNRTIDWQDGSGPDISGQPNNLPDSVEIYRNLYILFKGDYQQMEWFYENRTYADLMLMICVNNLGSRD